jgi:hypothetical protein
MIEEYKPHKSDNVPEERFNKVESDLFEHGVWNYEISSTLAIGGSICSSKAGSKCSAWFYAPSDVGQTIAIRGICKQAK